MSTYDTLISVAQLQALQAAEAPLMVFDCSFDLAQPQRGQEQYLQAHLPGARYVHLEADLSHHGPDSASGGRHPLPSRERFAAWLCSVGFDNTQQAVVYDRNGCNYCGRLWWMLQWAGHRAAAVLDGGLQAWQATGQASAQGLEPARPVGHFVLQAPRQRLVTVQDVLAHLGQATQTVLDARAPARYRGEVEPLDPVAGHIPGALNRPFSENLAADGRWKPAALLRAEWHALLQGRAPETVVHQCGSGVSAVPNLLALELAGLTGSALFAGSWSQWCSDSTRPVERG